MIVIESLTNQTGGEMTDGNMKEAETRREKQQREVDANYEAFKRQLPELLSGQYAGKHALIKSKKIVDFFATGDDAFYAGKKRFEDGIFSVQKVTDEVVDLRLWRHALPH